MMAAGFDIKPTQSAICAVMLYDAKLSQDFAAKLQDEGVFVTGLSPRRAEGTPDCSSASSIPERPCALAITALASWS